MSSLVSIRNLVMTYQRGPEKVHVLHGLDLEASEDVPISSFPRRRDYKAVTVTTDMPSLLQAAIDQNFVPVVDDRNVFIGMVRRTVILRDVYNKYGAKLDKPRQNTYTHA